LLCALPPLLAIRDIAASLVLRYEVETRRSSRRQLLAALPVAAGLSALALWQGGRLEGGRALHRGLRGGLLLLFLLARLTLAGRGGSRARAGSPGARAWRPFSGPGARRARCW
jgi:predicted lysophospholipase L1 biosynthesis ABC-type transport system permease subunit